MGNRELIEKIYELVKNCKERDWNNEETYTLYDIREKLEAYKIKYEIFDNYGVEIDSSKIYSRENISIDDRYANIHIRRILGKDNNRISNSDKQPNNELLMEYSHSTGSYMFGGGGWLSDDHYYDADLFDMYFEELKKYKYSYIDNINNSIYFTLEEGFKLYKNYKKICEKYQKLFNERRKKDKIDKMKKEIEELEGNE